MNFDPSNPLSIVRHFSSIIDNGRTQPDIQRHAYSEMRELDTEIHEERTGGEPGADGVVGEAIDVIACMLDLIFVNRPEITDEEINGHLLTKCEKWARRYRDRVDGDRSID